MDLSGVGQTMLDVSHTAGRNGSASRNADGPQLPARIHICDASWLSPAELLHELQLHPELDVRTVTYHLQQSQATAADGYCHAAINEARSFLEALVISMVKSVRHDPDGKADKPIRERTQDSTAFRTYRRYLLESGFIGADENDVLQYVYGIASVKGSHKGVTDDHWRRLSQQLVLAVGQYLIQRYTAWKQAGRLATRPTITGAKRRKRGWLSRKLTKVCRLR